MLRRPPTPVHFWSTRPSYDAHLEAIYDALPPRHRGEWISADANPPVAACTVVGAYRDVARCNAALPVLVEHGVGQIYADNAHHPAYSAAPKDGVALWLTPRHTPRTDVRTAAVGCPKLDPWLRTDRPQRRKAKPTVAISFHWPCGVSLEAGTAWHTYRPYVERLVEFDGFNWLGHAHPLFADTLEPWWRSLGVEYTPDFADVLNTADLYVCDNSSTIFEFAATHRPVVLLNDPVWRRDLEHGLRFWEYADVGVQVNSPGDILTGVTLGLHETPTQARRREQICDELYAYRDGFSSQRAAGSILKMLSSIKMSAGAGRASGPSD